MAWIESHQELAGHPKTKKLARKLNVSVPATIGYLHCLWWWAMDYAQEGRLGRYEPDDIADAMMWEGDSQLLITSLVEVGFLEQEQDGLHIHDWYDYAGRLIEKKNANKERMRKARKPNDQGKKEESATHVQRTTNERTGATDLTEPYQTNQTETASKQQDAYTSEELEFLSNLSDEYGHTFSAVMNTVQGNEVLRYFRAGMESDLIMDSMKRTRLVGKDFVYFLGALKSMNEHGICTIGQAEMEREEYRKRRSTNAKRDGPLTEPKGWDALRNA